MTILPDIRPLFCPVQPAVREMPAQVRYTEVLPDFHLARYIYCYWQLRTQEPLTQPFSYRVVADGCMDLFYDAGNPEENFIMGFSATYTTFPLQQSFNYIGIRFLPAAIPLLFKIDAAALTDRFELLAHVIPSLAADLGRMGAIAAAVELLKPHFDHHFLRLLSTTDFDIDSRLFDAIERILRSQGTIPVERELNTGISPRQLRRLFNYYIGDTPKTFSKVVRFQHVLNAKPSLESLRKNKLFYDSGYYDQAHFVKDFKVMYGLTPTDALK
ncbi:helix-turn-helix domain-containing protein [Chitinophaga pendula]|uniref:AraC family transcriptional regulator n=1 Tax=Chitinophaga TaxID=79328 RepID=UPI000BB0C830|nr:MULTISPECIES: helix-turn-helix domain-containing protein [Chitinophaga]ASZ14111.1 transcriptional regulator [Chitinophaga sp. MD30]UCJ08254.1 helix-turn-helix domain-containing protein [Chitinophaga pendula]